MQPTAPASYCHPTLLREIQQPPPEYNVAVHAVRDAQTLVQDTKQALRQAEQQLAQAQEQLLFLVSLAEQEHCQLVQELQTTQRACWNQSLTADLSWLILGKTSRYNVKMMTVSCPLLRDIVNTAEPIRFEVSPWTQTRIAAGGSHTFCVNAGGSVFGWGNNAEGQLGVGGHGKQRGASTGD